MRAWHAFMVAISSGGELRSAVSDHKRRFHLWVRRIDRSLLIQFTLRTHLRYYLCYFIISSCRRILVTSIIFRTMFTRRGFIFIQLKMSSKILLYTSRYIYYGRYPRGSKHRKRSSFSLDVCSVCSMLFRMFIRILACIYNEINRTDQACITVRAHAYTFHKATRCYCEIHYTPRRSRNKEDLTLLSAKVKRVGSSIIQRKFPCRISPARWPHLICNKVRARWRSIRREMMTSERVNERSLSRETCSAQYRPRVNCS